MYIAWSKIFYVWVKLNNCSYKFNAKYMTVCVYNPHADLYNSVIEYWTNDPRLMH